MTSCPICSSVNCKRSGVVERAVMSKSGPVRQRIQAYRCEKGHYFRVGNDGLWDDSFIEFVVFTYLRCLSLNTTIEIIRAIYEKDILGKAQILSFIESLADALPTLDDIDRLFSPVRSGYLAFDGVWFSYGNDQIVLLICFDPVSFDIVAAIWSDQETGEGYQKLIRIVVEKLPKQKIKGIYGDGDNGLIQALKHYFPYTPFQLCVVHKNLRMEQTVPVKLAAKSHHIEKKLRQEILEFAKLFHDALYADTKEEALDSLTELLHWTNSHPREKFVKAVNQLKRNFNYTLTHFDYPDMQRDNNLLECFNGCLKPKLNLMKGFKRKDNLDRYLKLFLLEFRFRPLRESRFKDRRGLSPLEVGGVYLPKYYNFISYLRTHLKLSFQPTVRT